MTDLLRPCSTLFIFLLCITSHAQHHLYVSVTGSDRDQGTEAAPFQTIEKAKEAVRQLNGEIKEDIIIHIGEGTYFLDKPLVFTSLDGGRGKFYVKYVGDTAGEVIISGGKQVYGWEPATTPGLYQAPLKAENFRQLYINGKRAIRARYPDKGTFLETKGWDFDKQELVLKGDFSRLQGKEGLELKLFQSWAESYLRVKSIQVEGISYLKYSHITFHDNESQVLFNRPYPVHKPSHRAYFENEKSFIDQDREWFLDTGEGIIYYKPSASEDPSKIEAIHPDTDTLLIVKGERGKEVRNLAFKGLSFRYSNWDYPSRHGYLNGQTGQHNHKATPRNEQYVKRPPAAVYVANAAGIVFERNNFCNLGATGIDFHHGVSASRIEGNTFHDIAGNAISIGKFTQDEGTEFHVPYDPADRKEICEHVVVSNNIIKRAAADYSGCVGIAAGYPKSIQITHNVIEDLPYSGISVGFGWTDRPNAMSNNFIAYNAISRVVQLMNDGAAIYTLSYQPGTKIYRNYIHDLPQPTLLGQKIICAVYCDERSGGSEKEPMIIEENIIDNGTSTMYKFNQAGIIIMKNNIQNKNQKNGAEIIKEVGLEAAYKDLKVDY